MSKHQVNELGYVLTGAITAGSVGAFIFQMVGTFLLGILGALGGWVFIEFIQPKLKKLRKKA